MNELEESQQLLTIKFGLLDDDLMNILPSFSVIPKKTFLGLDKSKGHCFTLKKTLTKPLIDHFKFTRLDLQREITLVTSEGDFPATLRLIFQDKSRPNKINIERNWKKREVLSIGWKAKKETIKMINSNLEIAINLVSKGLKNNRQSVSFEHLGGNRFYLSFNSTYL